MIDLKSAFGKAEYRSFYLKNGLKVVAVIDDGAPSVRGTVIVHAGAKDSPNTGIAHYFEHMMFKGTTTIGTADYESEKPLLDRIEDLYGRLAKAATDRARKAIQRDINLLSIKASKYSVPNDYANLVGRYGGSDLNAATSYDYTRYDHNFSPEYFEHWCRLNSERLLHPVFRLFQSELETVYEEKNMLANRLGAAEQQLIAYKKAFPHPYAYPIIGSTEALLNPDLRGMKAFFEKYYVAGNMGLVLTGPLPHEGLEEMLEETFGRLPKKPLARTKNPAPLPFEPRERMYVRSSTMHAKTALLLWHTVPLGHRDLLPLQVLQELLNNDSKTGALDELVIQGRLLEAVGFNSSMRETGDFSIYVLPLPSRQTYSQAQALILKALADLRKPSEANLSLFRRVRLSLLKTQLLNLEGRKSRHSALVNLMKEGSSLEELETELDRLEAMAYSEIQRVLDRYFHDRYLDVRERKGTYPVERIEDPGYEPVSAPLSGAKSPYAAFLETLEIRPKRPAIQDLPKEGHSDLLLKDAKARLFHNTDAANGIFTLDILHFRRKPGRPAAEILAQYLELVGGGGFSSADLFARFQDLGATLAFSSREDSFLISLSGFEEHLRESLRLMSAFLASPERSPEILKQKQTTFRLNYETQTKTEKTLFAWAFGNVLRGKEAWRAQTFSPGEIDALTLDDLFKELRLTLSSEVDIHYSGSLPQDEVKKALLEAMDFSSVTRPSDGYSYHTPYRYDSPRLFLFDDPNHGSQSLIGSFKVLGVLSPSANALLDFYAFYLGGYMGSVLFQEVREYRSLAYSVQSYSITPHPAFGPDEKRVSALCSQLFTREDKTKEALETLETFVNDTPFTLEGLSSALSNYRGEALRDYPDSFRMASRRAALLLRSGYTQDPIADKLALTEEEPGKLLARLKAFHEKVIKPAPFVHTLFGNAESIEKGGLGLPIERLTLEEITKPFPYK